MRVGTNPFRDRHRAYHPKKIGIASLTCIPMLGGFFRDALDILAVHLESIRRTAPKVNVWVFDNGSCNEVVDFLTAQQKSGVIDWLLFSRHNMGKTGALNWIFAAMPNEYIVYTDSDVLFRPGWLERSLEVFSAFEKVGMVSAQPAFFDRIPGLAQTAAQLAASPQVALTRVKPQREALQEYCNSIGADEAVYRRLAQRQLEMAITSGVSALVGTTHMQFMLRRELARRLVPLPVSRALTSKDDFEINTRVSRLGYLQLSLPEMLVYHLGNRLQAQYVDEIPQGSRVVSQRRIFSPPPRGGVFAKLLAELATHSSWVEQLLRRLSALLFDILYFHRDT